MLTKLQIKEKYVFVGSCLTHEVSNNVQNQVLKQVLDEVDAQLWQQTWKYACTQIHWLVANEVYSQLKIRLDYFR